MKILVVGDLMLDAYLHGEVYRISPEAPVPIILRKSENFKLGGAANVAMNIANLDVNVSVLGVVGRDADGDYIKNILYDSKIKSFIITSDKALTTKKQRVTSRNQQIFRVDTECKIVDKDLLSLIDREFEKIINEFGVVVFSDYDKGVLNNISEFLNIAREKKIKTIVDPKFPDMSVYKKAHIITPNKKELEGMLGKWSSEENLNSMVFDAVEKFSIDYLLLTRSEEGVSLYSRCDKTRVDYASHAIDISDVTGAGDTVVAVLASLISKNYPIKRAVEIANAAAGVVVGKFGTAIISKDDIKDYL